MTASAGSCCHSFVRSRNGRCSASRTLSIFLVFIGLPMFFVGLAVMEVGLKGWP